MWRRLPLNLKLLVSLISVQACLLIAGAVWLLNWIETTQFQALAEQLDSQSDVIEDMIMFVDGKLTYQRSGEVAAELDHDNDTYFELRSDKDEFLAESEGPAGDVRDRLKAAFITLNQPGESTGLQRIKHGKWLVQTESVSRRNGDVTLTGIIHVAVNAAPTSTEISEFKKIITFAAMVSLLLTTFGSVLVVSYSTRNLRKFATQLRALDAPLHMPNIKLIPQSAEEKMLFDSYSEMASAVRSTLDSQRIFIANASHELKTPIAAIMSALEVILSKKRTEEFYESMCKEMLLEAQGLKRLSTELLNLAKLENSNDSDVGFCGINEVAEQVCSRWQREADEKKIIITSDVNPNCELYVKGAKEQWEIILSNLIDNAIKYGKSGGHVWVSVKADGDLNCEITVVDDGVGMSDFELNQLGNLFFRADQAREGNNSFGLGFAHAKASAERVGARFSVESHINQGTNIKITASIYPADH